MRRWINFACQPRRWFRYHLRTLLVLMTVACVYFGWATHWIRQRHEFLARSSVYRLIGWPPDLPDREVSAPASLRVFGEPGIRTLMLVGPAVGSEAEARGLFPEATVVVERRKRLKASEIFPEASVSEQ